MLRYLGEAAVWKIIRKIFANIFAKEPAVEMEESSGSSSLTRYEKCERDICESRVKDTQIIAKLSSPRDVD